MPWIKLDDGLPDNPKIMGLSDSAFRLYITLLCYSNRYLTDGHIPQVVLERYDRDLTHLDLEINGLVGFIDGGIEILNYTEYQSSKEDIERKKAQNRERVKRFRGNALVMQPETETETETEIKTPSAFDVFWSAYPRKVGKQDALRAYAKALKIATADEILEGATRYAKDPNRIDQFTPHPATWLNRGSWSDQALPERAVGGSVRPQERPTVVPPRYVPENRSEAKPMPENIKRMIRSGFTDLPDVSN